MHPIIHSSPNPSTKFSEVVCESSDALSGDREQISFKSAEEPLYSTVNKKKKNKVIHPDVTCRTSSLHSESYEKSDSEYISDGEVKIENVNLLNKMLVEKDEEIKLLVEQMKHITKENSELQKENKELCEQKKELEKHIEIMTMKEESLHANLNLKITQFEADTHEKVNCLSEQIKVLQKERKVLSDQIQTLYEENKSLKNKNEDLHNKMRSMISPEFMKKKMDEQEKLMNQIKKNHLEEVKKLQEENEVLLESKVASVTEVEDLKQKMKILVDKNEALKSSEEEILQEKSRILLQLEESKHMQQEAETILIALLKISEAISIERDVLLNKSSFQDHQQKLLQSTMIDYSLNMGRLQEHISSLSRDKMEELKKLKSGELHRDESMKKFYEKQIDLLQSKIHSQTNIINDLENEKSKLESQLQSLWQAVCSGKPKYGDET